MQPVNFGLCIMLLAPKNKQTKEPIERVSDSVSEVLPNFEGFKNPRGSVSIVRSSIVLTSDNPLGLKHN